MKEKGFIETDKIIEIDEFDIKFDNAPIYERLYPIREKLFLGLDNFVNEFLDATIQGSGKTIASLKLAGKYNKTTIIFVDNYRKAMEVYDEWKTYNNAVISFLVSRTYKLNPKMKKAISEILGIDFKADYICNECNTDDEILELYNKKYIEREHCQNCKSKGICNYFALKEHSLRKRQFKENRLIILVKSYMHTPFVRNELLTAHLKDFGLIIDEGFLEIMTKQVVFSRSYISNKMYQQWIDMVDWIVYQVNQPDEFITIFWKDIKELLETILDYSLQVKEREKQIEDILIKLFDDYDITDFLKWNNLLKQNIYYYYKNELDVLIPNQFYDIQMMFEDIDNFGVSDEIRDRIFINESNKEFTYIINYVEDISDYFEMSKNCVIPASNLNKEFFEELLPNHKNKYKYLKGEDRSKFKVVYQIRKFNYFKPTVYNPKRRKDKNTGVILDKFTSTFYILLDAIKTILEIEKGKKVLIVAQLDIIKKIKKSLKVILKERNTNTVNTVSIEYYYNLEGINVYKSYDVVILFGGAGIPPKLLKLLSKILKVSISKLKDYYVNQQHLQCIERLRSVIYPYKKVAYVLTNVDLPVPKEQIIKFSNINEIILLKRLKEIGASKTSECLKTYNKHNKKPIDDSQFGRILKRMEKDKILIKLSHKTGNKGRPSSYWTVPI